MIRFNSLCFFAAAEIIMVRERERVEIDFIRKMKSSKKKSFIHSFVCRGVWMDERGEIKGTQKTGTDL